MLMRWIVSISAMALLAACATSQAPPAAPDASAIGGQGAWAAYGYLAPVRTEGGEFIGAFDSKADCQAAVDGWMARQVVGNPVSGECLPVDPR